MVDEFNLEKYCGRMTITPTTIDGHTGDLFTVDQYQDLCCGTFEDHSGWGHAVKDGQLMNVTLVPSWCPRDIPRDATHVLWYPNDLVDQNKITG